MHLANIVKIESINYFKIILVKKTNKQIVCGIIKKTLTIKHIDLTALIKIVTLFFFEDGYI